MEFKIIKDQINELEYQETNNLLTTKGLTYLKELKVVLKQREEMLEMFKSLLNESDDIVHSEIKKEIRQLIKEATEL